MPRLSRTARRGLTLIELVLVVTLTAVVSLLGVRQLGRYLDHIAAHDATRAAANVIARARDEAVALHAPVVVRIDTAAGTIELQAHGNAFAHTALGAVHGVSLTATRDSIAFDVRGLGYGAANLTLTARRGAAADTLVVSRLGRVRF